MSVAGAALLLALFPALARAEPPAFPGALGFGAVARGGRGGEVVHVTTLSSSGKGSLVAALGGAVGPRIVVFDVGGVIHLKDEIRVPGRVTILGQTAPGDGITIEGGRLVVVGDDVIIRGLHLRPGKGKGEAKGARDGLSVGAEGRLVRRVIVDHNSLMWATDENLSTWYRVQDVTFSDNLIAEGLQNAGHPEGRHSMGMLIGEVTERISVLRNVFVSNFWRNPQIEACAGAEVINNLIYNYGPGGILVSGGPSQVDIIGNVLIPGPDTVNAGTRAAIELKDATPGSAYYLSDNETHLGRDAARGAGLALVAQAPLVLPQSGTPVLPAQRVRSLVLSEAGARLPRRDQIDARLIEEAASGSGGGVVSRSWGGKKWRPAKTKWPEDRDRDHDGIPDFAEPGLGLDPNVADSARIDPASGYAFIEIYANGLFGNPPAP